MIGISTDKKAWTTQLICIFLGSLSSKKVRYFPCSILAEGRIAPRLGTTNHSSSGKHLMETGDDPPTRRRSDLASGLYQTQGGHQSFLSHHRTEGLGVDPLGITGYTPALEYLAAA